MLYIKQQHHKQ